MSISGGVRIVVRVDQEIDPYKVRCSTGSLGEIAGAARAAIKAAPTDTPPVSS